MDANIERFDLDVLHFGDDKPFNNKKVQHTY